MTTKHTPGPWIVELGNQISTHEFQPVGIAHVMRQGGCEEANARLIAAAPDMLEALRNIEAWTATPGECTLDVVRACVRRTLAKTNQDRDGSAEAICRALNESLINQTISTNARLLAAAPDMLLEALQAIVEADGQPDEVLQMAMIRARAVLAEINQE